MKRIVLLSLLFSSWFMHAQTYPVGHMSVNFKDASRAGGYSIAGAIQMPGTGRDIGAEIYYPAVAAGSNSNVATGQFPVVVFGHGFVMTYDNYDNIYNQLASLGFIVALPRTEGGVSPNHLDFAGDLALLAQQVQTFNSISTPTALSVFNGKVLPKSAIGGHSMGGGCSFIAAENNTNLTCLFNMAAATSNTTGLSSIDGATLVSVPTLVISGQRDCIADSSVQNSHYANVASTKKFEVILKDITHCDFGNGSSFTCTLGQSTSGCVNTISNSLAFARYMDFLVPFLQNQLQNNCAAGNEFMDSINTASDVLVGRKIVGTLACNNIGINETTKENLLMIAPNPAKQFLQIQLTPSMQAASASIQIKDLSGRLLIEKAKSASSSLYESMDLSALAQGVYILQWQQDNQTISTKFVKE